MSQHIQDSKHYERTSKRIGIERERNMYNSILVSYKVELCWDIGELELGAGPRKGGQAG